MKISNLTGVAFAASLMCFSVPNADAAVFQYDGVFTVNVGIGAFAPFTGQEGTFFFVLDYDATDPDPNTINGDIPGAVLQSGFSIGGQTFIDTTATPLAIVQIPPDFQIIVEANPASSETIPDIDYSIFSFVDTGSYISNPLSEVAGGQYGALFLFLALKVGQQTGVFAVGPVAQDILNGLGAITAITEFNPNPDPEPDPDPQTDPDPQLGVVPVPAGLPLLAAAIGGLFAMGWRRRTA